MANSILQLNSSDEYRGRVMGVYTVVFAGAMPIGNFICGYVAEKIGAAATFSILGAIIAVTVVSAQTIRGSMNLTGSRKGNPVQ